MSETHVISALREKRAQLSSELIQTEKRLVPTRADLESLDGAIRVFDPSLVPTAIGPKIKRRPYAAFRHGEFSRAVLSLLRRNGTGMTVREIATQVASDYRIDTNRSKAMDALIAKVRATSAGQKDGTLASERREDGTVLWRVV